MTRWGALAGRCQDAIADLSLDLVPANSMHLTMGRLAFTDEISARQADGAAGAARELCAGMSPFDLAVGPLAGSRGAVRLSVSPWRELLELHQRLHHAATIVGVAPPSNSASFRPHISIAYNNHIRPAAPVIEAVASLRSLAPVRASVAEAQLVILRRDGKAYRWEPLASVQIGTQSQSWNFNDSGRPWSGSDTAPRQSANCTTATTHPQRSANTSLLSGQQHKSLAIPTLLAACHKVRPGVL
jgi:2'-5' RNA ligase